MLRNEKDFVRLLMKKIKMKGLHMPQLFLWTIGKIHNRRGLIVENGDGYDSPYINKKIKDYYVYATKVYQHAAELLSWYRLIKEQACNELEAAEEKLKIYPQTKDDEAKLTVAEHRRIIAEEKEKRKLEEIRTESLQKINVVDVAAGAFETELEEMLLGTRYKLEGRLFTYLDGARKVAKKEDLDISVADGALRIYRACVPKRKEECLNEGGCCDDSKEDWR